MLEAGDHCKLGRIEDWKQGAVRRTYKTFGREKMFQSRHRASWECNKERHSPNNSKDLNFADRVQSVDWSPPMGHPRRHASAGSTHFKSGGIASMALLMAVLSLTTSVF